MGSEHHLLVSVALISVADRGLRLAGGVACERAGGGVYRSALTISGISVWPVSALDEESCFLQNHINNIYCRVTSLVQLHRNKLIFQSDRKNVNISIYG